MDMLPGTAPTKYHLQAHQCTVEITLPVGMIDSHLGIIATTDIPTVIIEIGTGSVIPDPTHTTLDTGVIAAMTPAGVAPDHFIDLCIIALHETEAQVHTVTTVTHHITDPHPIEISSEMPADPDYTNPTSNITSQHKDCLQGSQTTPWKNKDRRQTNRLQLVILPENTIVQMSRIVTPRTI